MTKDQIHQGYITPNGYQPVSSDPPTEPPKGGSGISVYADPALPVPFEAGKKYCVKVVRGGLDSYSSYPKCEYISNNGHLYWFKKQSGKILAVSGSFVAEEE